MADDKTTPAETTATDEIADEKLDKVSGGSSGLTAAEQAELAKLESTKLPSMSFSLTEAALIMPPSISPKG